MNTQKQIIAWGVYYVPTKHGAIFAGLKWELQHITSTQSEAINLCTSMNEGGAIDEMHIGYRVAAMHWIPKGWTF